jgi:Leucine-rich repeat (LRR) protein
MNPATDTDIIIEILSKLDPDSLINMCNTNLKYKQVCKDHKNTILQRILKRYNVEYTDPMCLIYYKLIRRNEDLIEYKFTKIDEFKRPDGSYKIGDIFKRFFEYYNIKDELDISELDITSIPSLPKLKILICPGNALTKIVGDFSNLRELECQSNQIVELGAMPRLKLLRIDENPIKQIGGFDSLRRLLHLEAMNMNNLEKIYDLNTESINIGNKRGNTKKIIVENVNGDTLTIHTNDQDPTSFEERMPILINSDFNSVCINKNV